MMQGQKKHQIILYLVHTRHTQAAASKRHKEETCSGLCRKRYVKRILNI